MADAPGRLAPPPDYPILRGPLGGAVLRPWFDAMALRLITRWYGPLSSAWAAACVAEGSIERFAEELGVDVPPRPWLDRALQTVAERQAAYRAAVVAWENTVFAPAPVDPQALIAAETTRRNAAHRFMAARARFLPLRRRAPPAKWEIADPDTVMARHGDRLTGAAPPFPAPADDTVEESKRIAGAHGDEYWLRFPSPSPRMGDTAWARVYEPAGIADPPTVIFLHGITMETELWRGAIDPWTLFHDLGVRLVQPEAPWHGRRMPPGGFGGEPAFARGPIGMIELFEAWVSEIATLTGWAKRGGAGPVAIGGISLGALTSQLAATAARDWPAAMRPDAACLLTTSGDMVDTLFDGSLAIELGMPALIRRRGWTRERLAQWRPVLEPLGDPVMGAENVVMLLGTEDTVTPYEGGRMLAERWAIPADNLFVSRRGHFSASLSLYRDRAPLQRLVALLHGDGTAR